MELVVKKSPDTSTLRSKNNNTTSSSASSTDGSNPFQRHDVQEWSRLDSITGMIEHARLQRDHWTANTHNSTQQYGKIIDSRDKSAADGNIQQRHRKQLEVFQTQTPGGSLQVIRTQTISSSTSRWSSSSTTSANASSSSSITPAIGTNQIIKDATRINKSSTTSTPTSSPQSTIIRTLNQDFENLQLALNPLDLSSQKSKASVGRSGSIGGRRPPTRPRSYISSRNDNNITLQAATTAGIISSPSSISPTHFENDVESSLERVSEICQKIQEETINNNNILNGFTETRTKSNSSENLDNLDNNSDEYLEDWRRTAKIRRSLQISKLTGTTQQLNQSGQLNSMKRIVDLPNNTGNVNKIKQELEKGRRLNTALRGTNVDLDALDQILKSISPVIHTDINSKKFEPPEKDISILTQPQPHTGGYTKETKPVLNKRHSFITAESLQEVRGRLRRLSSPINYVYKDFESPKQESEPDDGIVAEETSLKIEETPSRVRSYVFGMETAMVNGRKTGSLESRTSSKNSNTGGNRTEDWYNRRKSYGFEQMHNQSDSNGLQSKVESSTDSGICRSTEITILPSKASQQKLHESNNIIRNNKSTVVNLTSNKRNEHVDPFSSRKAQEELNTVWNKIASMKIGNNNTNSNERESITIRIPIKNENDFNSTKIHLNSDHELKRHSIAVDESKYVTQNDRFPHLRRTSLAIPDNREYISSYLQDGGDDEFNQHGRKTKKVEFCKTEVHFAAESGRVNIVETDGKPPPTQNFRRRRRNSGGNQTALLIEENIRNGNLPLTHFGDTSYEKKLFSVIDEKYPSSDKSFEPIVSVDVEKEKYISNTAIKNGIDYEDEQKDSSENENTPKGILKNKPIKPKPYHLGENIELTNDSPWGVRLKPVHSSSDEASNATSTPPMWHSTVIVKNPKFKNIEEESNLTKFQKEFKQFKSFNNQSVSLSDDNSSDTTNNCIRRPSWSVADRIKQVEELKWTENKGYSTKINFGEIGEATIVDNNSESNRTASIESTQHSSWQNHDINTLDELKSSPVINKALVVRFGKNTENEHLTKYNENTKKFINNNNIQNDTTHSITRKSPVMFNNIKLPRATLHSLKSTSLIMNTIQQNSIKAQQEIHIPSTVPNIITNYQKSQTSDSISSESHHSITSNTTEDFIIPKQLEALKKLYEDAGELSDDSERADEEVRSYMSADTEDTDNKILSSSSSQKDDTSSVLSGSWSKMRAVQMSQTYKKLKSDLQIPPTSQINNNCSLNTIITMDNSNDKKYVESNRESVNQRWTKVTSNKESLINSTSNTYENIKNSQKPTPSARSYTIPTTEKFDASPKRNYPMKISTQKYYENTNNLASPSLVGLQSTPTTRTENVNNNKYFVTNGKTFEQNLRKYPNEKLQNLNENIAERKPTKDMITRRSQSPTKEVTYLNRRNLNKSNINRRSSSPTNNIRETIRLRPVPTYFGSIRSPRTPRKYSEKINVLEKSENNSLLTNKPDLLCHNSINTRINTDIKTKVIREINEEKTEKGIHKLHRDSPIPNSEKLPSPIYANLEEIKGNKYSSRTSETIENETAILEELTRAADQILLAVNGYTDEESLKISTEDDDEDVKRKRGQYERKTADVLGTISETKSWSQKTKVSEKSSVSSKVTQSTRLTKSRTPSTSSIESINTNSKTKIVDKKEIDDRHKRRSSNESSLKTTKARRLQRASSREALLQSHGSSSEDIATPIVPVRKPRATRRVKSHSENKEQINTSVNNSQTKRKSTSSQISRTSSSKKEIDVVKKERHSLTLGLPEIRHKTAVSTIRSSAEKQADREKLRRSEENRKRTSHSSKRDTLNSQGTTASSRLRSNHSMSNQYRSADGHGSSYGSNSHGIQTVPVERITTTNGNVLLNRRCSRNEALSRH